MSEASHRASLFSKLYIEQIVQSYDAANVPRATTTFGALVANPEALHPEGRPQRPSQSSSARTAPFPIILSAKVLMFEEAAKQRRYIEWLLETQLKHATMLDAKHAVRSCCRQARRRLLLYAACNNARGAIWSTTGRMTPIILLSDCMRSCTFETYLALANSEDEIQLDP